MLSLREIWSLQCCPNMVIKESEERVELPKGRVVDDHHASKKAKLVYGGWMLVWKSHCNGRNNRIVDPLSGKNQILIENLLVSRFAILGDNVIEGFVELNEDPMMADNLNHTQSHLFSVNKENLGLNGKSKKWA